MEHITDATNVPVDGRKMLASVPPFLPQTSWVILIAILGLNAAHSLQFGHASLSEKQAKVRTEERPLGLEAVSESHG